MFFFIEIPILYFSVSRKIDCWQLVFNLNKLFKRIYYIEFTLKTNYASLLDYVFVWKI